MRQKEKDIELKTSFPPISNTSTQLLILGSLPGQKSLEAQEYYAHPRNRFWKIISLLTGQNIPEKYSEKKELLLNHKIALWDVAQHAQRPGSLDSAIKNVTPNDIKTFIESHPQLRIIAFNGQKSQKLFDQYFQRSSHLLYLTLPSTSPANASKSWEFITEQWMQIKEFIS